MEVVVSINLDLGKSLKFSGAHGTLSYIPEGQCSWTLHVLSVAKRLVSVAMLGGNCVSSPDCPVVGRLICSCSICQSYAQQVAQRGINTLAFGVCTAAACSSHTKLPFSFALVALIFNCMILQYKLLLSFYCFSWLIVLLRGKQEPIKY